MNSNALHLLRLTGLFSVMFCLAALGCASTESPKDTARDACSGDACGGGETGGDALENRFAKTWDVALTLKGDAAAGRKFFYEETFAEGMSCAACHGFDKGDTMTGDADDYQRAGISEYAAKWRTNIKGTGSSNATLGGNVCVSYWQGGPEGGASAQQLADLDAFLKSEGGPKDHATAANIDYQARTFTIPETLTGGDTGRGADLSVKYCGTCHEIAGKAPLYEVGVRKLKGGVTPTDRLSKLAARIKDKGKKNNDFMPGFPDQRMPEQDLLDILAFFEKK